MAASKSTVIDMEPFTDVIEEEEAARTRREWYGMILLGSVNLAHLIYFWINNYV